MTREEQTISNLKKLKSFHNGSYGADIDRAIKALEQEPVIDKIRAEIQSLRNCSCSCSDGIIDDVEDIIDKYKAESEPRESEG